MMVYACQCEGSDKSNSGIDIDTSVLLKGLAACKGACP